jgi:hypothetical protein
MTMLRDTLSILALWAITQLSTPYNHLQPSLMFSKKFPSL